MPAVAPVMPPVIAPIVQVNVGVAALLLRVMPVLCPLQIEGAGGAADIVGIGLTVTVVLTKEEAQPRLSVTW